MRLPTGVSLTSWRHGSRSSGGFVAPGRVRALYVAKHYLYASDYDVAMDFIEKAFEVHDPGMPYLASDPLFDPLRSDPRFQDLLRQLNLPTTSGRSDPDVKNDSTLRSDWPTSIEQRGLFRMPAVSAF